MANAYNCASAGYFFIAFWGGIYYHIMVQEMILRKRWRDI